MEVFRITTESFSSKLTASGRPARWNKVNEFVLYTGSTRSLSTLELIVHRNSVKPDSIYKVMVIEIKNKDNLEDAISTNELPANWRSMSAYSYLRTIGSNWYSSHQSLILKVPSAVIVNEFNYIINTIHPAFFDCVKLISKEDYFWDQRILKLK